MAVCRHCGAVFEDVLEFCPDCGEKNTDFVNESYLDSLLSSLVENEPVRPAKKAKPKKEEILPELEETVPEESELTEILPELEEAVPEESELTEILPELEEAVPEESELTEILPELEEAVPEDSEAEEFAPDISFVENESPEASEEDFLAPDEDFEQEVYSIFDELEGVDVNSMITEELKMSETESSAASDSSTEEDDIADIYSMLDELEAGKKPEEYSVTEEPEEAAELFDFTESEMQAEPEMMEQPAETEAQEELFDDVFALDEDGLDELAYEGLDELLSDVKEDEANDLLGQEESPDSGLEEFLAAETKSSGDKGKKKKDERSFWQRVFGNVPVDPSKKKPEPTEEEIAATKKAKAESKKKQAEEKKLAAEEKKEAAKRAKEEKAKQAQLKKEEKNQKKLEEAKKLLAEMEDTRINRLGATIVFIFFAIIAVVLIVGTNLITYSVSIANAEKNFNQALNNDVKYYTEAYNHIYGLEMRNIEDKELEDKILTVMFVNKELNSYNSYMALEDYESALHSLIKGMYRYGKYIEHAFEIDIDEDMDFVRTQILKELEAVFDVSEDEAEVLKDLLSDSLSDDGKAMEYSTEIYRVVAEADSLQ